MLELAFVALGGLFGLLFLFIAGFGTGHPW